MTQEITDDLIELLKSVDEPMVEIRHDLHAHPELAFNENYTTRLINDRLVALGWELAPCPTATGAVAVLRGAKPGRRVMVRADIDALPVTEEVELSYASRNEGVMHACGHDVHTASLLGVADLLARRRDDLAGEFTLLFQPAEEALGGARAMIDGGVLETNPVDVVIGAHVTSLAPVGVVATRAGILMSEAAGLTVHIHGKGGHGAMASEDGNVVFALCHLAPRLAEVVSGLAYEGTNCACSAGVINAGSASNVVPRHAILRGTLRTFASNQQSDALTRLRGVLDEVEEKYNVTCVLEVDGGTPAVTNDARVVERVLTSAARVVGTRGVLTIPPISPSDDVSEFLRRVPGCYMLIGGALADGSSGVHHSPDFAIDDAACRVIAGVLAVSAVDLAQP
jgi:amidohydrolase